MLHSSLLRSSVKTPIHEAFDDVFIINSTFPAKKLWNFFGMCDTMKATMNLEVCICVVFPP